MERVSLFDAVFVLGDLNYRVMGEPEQIFQALKQNKFDLLRHTDQLQIEMQLGRSLIGFKEGQLNFAPTFKRLKGSNNGYNLKRKPSWTDRILFKKFKSPVKGDFSPGPLKCFI